MKDNDAIAHAVARHLRAIATLLPSLDAAQLTAFTPGITKTVLPDYCTMLRNKADRIEATAPFVPLDDEQRAYLVANIAEQLNDRSTRDALDDHTGDWTDADWRMEYDTLIEMEQDQ
jgi:hypothetical protein